MNGLKARICQVKNGAYHGKSCAAKNAAQLLYSTVISIIDRVFAVILKHKYN